MLERDGVPFLQAEVSKSASQPAVVLLRRPGSYLGPPGVCIIRNDWTKKKKEGKKQRGTEEEEEEEEK